MSDTEVVIDPQDRRKYVRLPSYCEIDYTLISLHGDVLGMDWQRGTTRNVCEGGLYIETKNFDYRTYKYLLDNKVYLDLRLHVPWVGGPIKAVAEVAWFRESDKNGYEIGLEFKSITKENIQLILRHTKRTLSLTLILKVFAVLACVSILAWAVIQFFAR